MQQLLEFFSDLINKLGNVNENTADIMPVARLYKALFSSEDVSEKEIVYINLKKSLESLYAIHSARILNRNFSFLLKEKISLLELPLSDMYARAVDSDKKDVFLMVNNVLLFLFYQIAPQADREIIDAKYRKKPAPVVEAKPTPKKSKKKGSNTGTSQASLAEGLEKIFADNQDALKRAENNSEAVPEVLAGIFQNNAPQMASMLSNVMKGIGLPMGGTPPKTSQKNT